MSTYIKYTDYGSLTHFYELYGFGERTITVLWTRFDINFAENDSNHTMCI